ncbi:Cellulose synthase-like protein [Rhynchospora pubera]|uniref:Cellulose synthase-like protein n=1 Tax=Rhynchospora pubera TaxID=906938 RepID=A0AAV8E3E5_9POAL|nr:Cellulose synthase-like protein [Rhynchospora pubera]
MDRNSDARSEGGYPASFAARRTRVQDFSESGHIGLPLTSTASMNDIPRLEGEYLANAVITGGYATSTRAHGLPRRVEERPILPPDICQLPGCNNKALDVPTCECDLRICAACFKEAAGPNGGGACPGCKLSYPITDLEELRVRRTETIHANDERTKARSNNGDWDAESYLSTSGFKRPFSGFGNASLLPEDSPFVEAGMYGGGPPGGSVTDGASEYGAENRFTGKTWRPLSRKISIPSAVLSPYRLFVLLRLVALVLFLTWRVMNVNHDAVWLWLMSVICEIWFAISWLLDQLPKLSPIDRATNLVVLKEKFETKSDKNPLGISDLPGIDVFVSTADPDKEPVLVTANTILSILAADYPVEKLACYVSDDGGSLLTYEALAEAAMFANAWVPFCRKHNIEPRNPESYFNLKKDPFKDKVRPDFVKDRRRVKREYDEYKVRINGLPNAIKRRSDTFNAVEDQARQRRMNLEEDNDMPKLFKPVKATWMADRTHWAGTWMHPTADHKKGDHAGIVQVLIKPAHNQPHLGNREDSKVPFDFSMVDVRLPMLVYVSREKRPGYDHNKKAGAMNALVRSSAIMSNGPFILNLDCDHYVNNSQAFREAMCFMMDRGGDRIAFIQFPQRFEGIDPSDRYSNHNRVFFDINMRALDGLQGPEYVGTGCMFRRIALYGFDPPRQKKTRSCCLSCCPGSRSRSREIDESEQPLRPADELPGMSTWPRKFGNSNFFLDSILVSEFNGRPLADHPTVKHGREPLALIAPREPLTKDMVAEAIGVISCWYEDKTDWGLNVGWVYGSVTEDVVTGYKMHTRGWRSVYCLTKRDAFRGTAPINLTDRLHQVLRWATGSVEIFFSRNNAFLAGRRLNFLQRIAYLNVGIYPFTSIFLIVYCFIPALSLFTNQFIVQTLSVSFVVYLLIITSTLCVLALLEIKWSGITLEEWWRNEQFWMIGGTSAHLTAVFQGILKVIAGIEISFTLTSKAATDDEEDEFADLYVVKWTFLMIPPITIMMVNIIAIAVGIARAVYQKHKNWGKLLGGAFFSFWVLAHLFPFAKGLMGRKGRTPTIVFIWSGLISVTIALLAVSINPPANNKWQIGGSFSFP